MAHPDVFEAAVIAVPDARWDERPLVCVVPNEGASLEAVALRDYLVDKVARWRLPERWTFIDSVPKTSVGKFDKKVLRAEYAEGELDVVTLERPPGLSRSEDPLVALAGRVRALAEELADLALDRLLDATERGVGDPKEKSAEERRLTRAARALEKAAADLEGASRAEPD